MYNIPVNHNKSLTFVEYNLDLFEFSNFIKILLKKNYYYE